MHGDGDFWLYLLGDSGGFFWINGEKAPHRDQKNVDRTDFSQFFITQEMTQVSEMTDLDIIDLKCEDGVGTSFTSFGSTGIRPRCGGSLAPLRTWKDERTIVSR